MKAACKLAHMKTWCLVLSIAPAGCETESKRYQRAQAELRSRIESISLGKGIEEASANELAYAYWKRFCPSCGMVERATDAGSHWNAAVQTGIFGAYNGDIFINKTNGVISWKKGATEKGPTVTNWSQLWW